MRKGAPSQRYARFVSLLRLAGGAAILSLLAPAVSAASSHCSNRHLFVYRPNVASGRGQATTVWVADFNPDLSCPFQANPSANTNRHHTAHVRAFLGNPTGVAEVGYLRGLDLGGTEHTWVFWGVENSVTGQISGQFIGTAAVSQWARFKVQINPTTGRWLFAWDRGLSNIYAPVGPTDGFAAGFTAGVPMGETAFAGGVDSTDTHDNLWYESSGYVWSAWTSQCKEIDEINTSHWHVLTGKSYRVHGPDSQHNDC